MSLYKLKVRAAKRTAATSAATLPEWSGAIPSRQRRDSSQAKVGPTRMHDGAPSGRYCEESEDADSSSRQRSS